MTTFVLLLAGLFVAGCSVDLRTDSTPRSRGPVLAVIAHPDDETMFGGVLGYLKENHIDVYLICITRGEGGRTNLVNGDVTQLAELRPEELHQASELYGVRDVEILNEPDAPFRDSKTGLPSRDAAAFLRSGTWNVRHIKDQIESYAEKINPEAVITLLPDNPAIHAHHQATGRLVMELYHSGRLGDHIHAVYAVYETHWYPANTFGTRDDQINFPMTLESKNLGMTYAEFQEKGAEAHASQTVSQAGLLNEDEILVPLYEKDPDQALLRSITKVKN